MQNNPNAVATQARRATISGSPGLPLSSSSACAFARGIHIDHGPIHNKLAKPSITKKGRHPNLPISVPPNSIPKLGPKHRPDATIEFAKPRRATGKWLAMIFEYDG